MRGDGESSRYPPPRKRLGQHFLTDPRILGRIADSLSIAPDDTVIEIGPGRGALTTQLLARAARVIAIEVDRDLAAILRHEHAADPRLTIVERDVLNVDFGTAAGGPYLVAGNVPYNITTPILFHALERPRPLRAVFLVQREVAERVVAAAGSAAYGALSVNVQAVAKATILFRLSPGSFTPPPTVDSALLHFVPLDEPFIAAEEESAYRAMVIGAFGYRRKQMGRVLRELWGIGTTETETLLARAGIESRSRPEVLTPRDFAALLRCRLAIQNAG